MKIFVDPGHGGRDPGTVAPDGTRECDVALMYGRAFRSLAEGRGHEVEMSRETDTDLAPPSMAWSAPPGQRSGKSVDLAGRSQLSNQFRPDVFVSFHANAALSPKANGAWVIFDDESRGGPKFAKAVFARLEALPGIADADAEDEVFPDDSPATGGRDLAVLGRATRAPAILVELGFLSNPGDLAQLTAKQTVLAVCLAVVQGLEDAYPGLPLPARV